MATGKKTAPRVRAPHLGPERRRPQVLDAALALVLERGTRAVTMDGLAEQLGVSKPVIYACFTSREDLLTTLLEREEQKLLAGVMSMLPPDMDFTDPERTLVAGFQAMFRLVETHTASWQLVFVANPDSVIAERYGMARRIVRKRVKDLMKRSLAANIPDLDRKLPLLVDFFMATGESAVQAIVNKDRHEWSPDELGVFVARFILGGIRSALAPEDKNGRRRSHRTGA